MDGKICCFTGHRPEKLMITEEQMRERLESAVVQAVCDGFTTYLSGMAKGTDLVAAEIVLCLRENDPRLKLVCAMPFEGFGQHWTDGWTERMRHVLENADSVHYVSLNTFAKHTNVDANSRIVCYDIRDLGKQLLPVGMLVVLDSVFNRIIRNRQMGRSTWIYIDEIYLLFQHEYSANFLFTLWKRVRKYGACCSGLTQNVDVRPDRALCKAV